MAQATRQSNTFAAASGLVIEVVAVVVEQHESAVLAIHVNIGGGAGRLHGHARHGMHGPPVSQEATTHRSPGRTPIA